MPNQDVRFMSLAPFFDLFKVEAFANFSFVAGFWAEFLDLSFEHSAFAT